MTYQDVENVRIKLGLALVAGNLSRGFANAAQILEDETRKRKLEGCELISLTQDLEPAKHGEVHFVAVFKRQVK